MRMLLIIGFCLPVQEHFGIRFMECIVLGFVLSAKQPEEDIVDGQQP